MTTRDDIERQEERERESQETSSNTPMHCSEVKTNMLNVKRALTMVFHFTSGTKTPYIASAGRTHKARTTRLAPSPLSSVFFEHRRYEHGSTQKHSHASAKRRQLSATRAINFRPTKKTSLGVQRLPPRTQAGAMHRRSLK